MTVPADGFTNPPFAQLFSQSNFTNSTTAITSTPPSHIPPVSKGVHKGVNVGAVIGGIAGLALIAGAVAFLLCRNRRVKSYISRHQISAPVEAPAPVPGVADTDPKPPVELENEPSYFELPADRVYEIRGTELVKPAGQTSEIGRTELTKPGRPEDTKKYVPYI